MSYQQKQQKCQLPAKCLPKCPPKSPPQAPQGPTSSPTPCPAPAPAPSSGPPTCCVTGSGRSRSVGSHWFPRVYVRHSVYPGPLESSCCANVSFECSSYCHGSSSRSGSEGCNQ